MATTDFLEEYKIVEKERQLLLAEIGQSITSWSFVETELYRIFHHCIGAPALNPSAAAFNAVENFRSKLAMTDGVVKSYLGKDQLRSIWDRKNRDCLGQSKARNFIAHGTVVVLAIGKMKGRPYLIGYSPMRPNPSNTRNVLREKRYDLKAMRNINAEFLKLSRHLGEFCKKLPPH
jgi:hypothetical protein